MGLAHLIKGLFKKKVDENSTALQHKEEEILRKEFAYTSETSLAEVLGFIEKESGHLTITLSDAATKEDIAAFECGNFRLPDDFKMFYQFSNGFQTLDWLFNIIPLQDMAANRKEGLHQAQSFHFAEYMVYAEIWSVEIKQADHYSIYKHSPGKEPMVLTNSLAEFLARYVNGGVFDGLLDWDLQLENPDNKAG